MKSASLGGIADERLRQIRAWYADPVRELPRKVIGDVARLLATIAARDEEIARLRHGKLDTLAEVQAERDLAIMRADVLREGLLSAQRHLKGEPAWMTQPLKNALSEATSGLIAQRMKERADALARVAQLEAALRDIAKGDPTPEGEYVSIEAQIARAALASPAAEETKCIGYGCGQDRQCPVHDKETTSAAIALPAGEERACAACGKRSRFADDGDPRCSSCADAGEPPEHDPHRSPRHDR